MSSSARLLTAREASAYLGVSLNTLNRIEKRGLILPFRTPGGHRRYDVQMLDDYLESSRQTGRREAA
ncbi:MAG TPA: helix-turn-helix domain-containing protein [Anaerolineales bacterium]|nr:helix-turn-helix domain-containing protein [Anaerolineales bacterium]